MAFSPISARRLCHADEVNKAETAVHGCHCLGDMAMRMCKELARPWVGERVCHLTSFAPSYICPGGGGGFSINRWVGACSWDMKTIQDHDQLA